MIGLRSVLAAVVLLALIPTGSASAAPAAKRCTAKDAKTLVKNRFARVFTTPHGGDEFTTSRLFGCVHSTGRRVLLDVATDDAYTSYDEFRKVRLNGRFVAWEHESYDISCKADCPPGYQAQRISIRTRDLRAKRSRSFAGTATGENLVVGVGGTPAWLQGSGDQVEVHAGTSVLDTGPIDSLTLSGTMLSWLNAGTPRGAGLR